MNRCDAPSLRESEVLLLNDRLVKEMEYANSLKAIAARLHAALLHISEHYDARSELYTSDADCAAGMADIAKRAIAPEIGGGE